jgi:hypothetical protein
MRAIALEDVDDPGLMPVRKAIAIDPSEVNASRDTAESRLESLFTDDAALAEVSARPSVKLAMQASPLNDKIVKQAAIGAYLSHQLKRDVSPLEYPSARDGVARAEFGKENPSDEEMFALVRGKFEWKQKEEAAVDDLHVSAISQALDDAANGRQTSLAPTFQAWAQKYPDLVDGKNDSGYLTGAFKMYQQARWDVEKSAPIAGKGLNLLQQLSTGQGNEEELRSFAIDVSKMPTEDREKAYRYIALGAKARQVDLSVLDQNLKNFGESFTRGFDFLPQGAGQFDEGVARARLKEIEGGRFSMRDNEDGTATVLLGDFYGKEGTRQPTTEEIQSKAGELREILPMFQVMRELRALARNEVDPVKPQWGAEGSFGGTIEAGLLGLTGSVGLMGATAVNPMVGVSAYKSSELDRILLENPKMDWRAANQLAFVEGAANATIDRMQLGMLTGKLPIFGRMLAQIRSNTLRRTLKGAAMIAEQNIQEGAQDLIAPIAETFLAALREDMPDKDFSKLAAEWAGSRAETFWATLPLALIGMGAASVSDFKMEPRDALRAGFSEKQIKRISLSSSAAEADAVIQKEWEARTPENISKAATIIEQERTIAEAQQASSATATVRAVGNGEFAVDDKDGTEQLRTKDMDAALMAVRDINAASFSGQRSGIAEASVYIGQVNEAIGRGEDVQKLMTEQAPRSLLDEYNANPTSENLDRLFETVRFHGEEINDVSELGQYFVKASNRGSIKGDVYRSIIRVHEGANGLHVMRDFAQDNMKRAVAEGDVSIDWVRGQLAGLAGTNGFEGIRTESDTDVIESFSDVAVAYFHGRIKDAAIPAGLRGFLRKMAVFVKEIFIRSYRLKRAIADGKVGENFQQLLATSVGLDTDQIIAMEGEKAQRRMEREALDQLENGDFAQGGELLKVLKGAKLPDEKSPFWNEGFARLKEAVRETNKWKSASEKIKLSDLFSHDAVDPDLNVVGALQENGFDFFTVDDLTQAVEARIVSGNPQFGTKANEAMQGANYSIGKISPPDSAWLGRPRDKVDLGRLSPKLLELLGKTDKPVILTAEVAEKNAIHHPEITFEESRNIISSALTAPDILINDKPKTKPDYWIFVSGADKSDSVLVELSETKDAFEVVNWIALRGESVSQKIKRAGREGGQVLITGESGAAGLSALTSNSKVKMALDSIGVNYSIGKAGEDRVSAALESRLKRNPVERLAVYARAKAAFDVVRNRRGDIDGAQGAETKFAKALQSLGELDAILKVLPPEIRGKVGGYTTIAKIGQDTKSGPGVRSIDRFLEKRVEMVGREIEKFLSKEYRAAIDKLFKKSLPSKSDSGVLTSTLGPEAASFVKSAYTASLMDVDGAADRLAEIEGLIEKEEDGKKAQALVEEYGIVNMFGGLAGMDVEKLSSALDELKNVVKGGREKWRIQQQARVKEIRDLTKEGVDRLGKTTPEELNLRLNKKGRLDFLNNAGNRHLAPFQLMEMIFGKEHPITRKFSDGLRKASNEKNARDMEVRKGFDDAARVALGFKPGQRGMGIRFAIDAELAKLMVQKPGVQAFHGRKVRRVQIPIPLAEKIARGELGESSPKDDSLTAKLEEEGDITISEDSLPPLTGKNIETIREELAAHNERMANRDFEKMSDPNARQDVGPRFIQVDQVYREGTLGPRTISGFEAMQFLATWRQPDGRAHMERNGFTEKSVQQMDLLVDSQFAKAIYNEMLRQYAAGYDSHNSIYRSLYGVNMPRNPIYSPFAFQSETPSDAPMMPGEMSQAGGMMAGHIKSRTKHNAPIQQANMARMFWRHFDTANYWISHASLVRDMRAVLLNRDLMDSVTVSHGPAVAQAIKDMVQLFTDGGAQVKHREYEEIYTRLIQGISTVTLGFKLSSVVNQSDAAMRFSMRLSAKQQRRALASLLTGNFLQKYGRAFNSQTVQQRLQLGSNPIVRMVRENTKFSPSFALQLVEAGYLPMQYTDGALTAFSGAVVYESAFLEAKDSGMTDAQADIFAAEEMDRAIFETAQPADMAQKSIEENMGDAWKRGLMMFMSDQRMKFAAWGSAYRGLITDQKNIGEHARVIIALGVMGVSGELVRAMYRDWFTDDDDEEVWNWKNFARAFALGPINGFFIFGNIMDSILKGFTGEHVFSPSSPLTRFTNDVTSTARSLKKNPLVLVDFQDPEKTMQAWKTAARAAAAVDKRAALPAYFINLAEPLLGLAKNIEEED